MSQTNDISSDNTNNDAKYEHVSSSAKKKKKNERGLFPLIAKLFGGWCGADDDISEKDNLVVDGSDDDYSRDAKTVTSWGYYFREEEKIYILSLREKLLQRMDSTGRSEATESDDEKKRTFILDQLLECIAETEGRDEEDDHDEYDENDVDSDSAKKDSINDTTKKGTAEDDMLQEKMAEIAARMEANFSSMPTTTSVSKNTRPISSLADSNETNSGTPKEKTGSKSSAVVNKSNDEILRNKERRNRAKIVLQVLSVARKEGEMNVDIWDYILDQIFCDATTTKDAKQQDDNDSNNKRKEAEENSFLNNVASALGRGRKGEEQLHGFALSILFRACYNCCNDTNASTINGDEQNQGKEEEQIPMVVDASTLIQAWYDTMCLCHILSQILEQQQKEGRNALQKQEEIAQKIVSKCYPTHCPKSDLSFLIQALSSFDDANNAKTTIVNEEKNTVVTLNQFCSWSKEMLPLMHAPIIKFLREHVLLLFSNGDINHITNSSVTAREEVNMSKNKKSFILGEYPNPRSCTVSCMSPYFARKWHRLYASDHDGLSFQSLQHSLLGYSGPTLLLIQSTSSTNRDGNSIIGAYTSTPIQNKGDTYFGNNDCFLFRLGPDIQIYRPSKNGNQRFVFFRGIPTGKVRPDLSVHGWGFGGVARSPRLFVRGTFEDCTAAVRDTTYNHGPLLSTGDVINSTLKFDIESLEVWGVGDDANIEQALHSYGGYRQTADAALEKARTVDKAQFMADFKSGMIESKMFVHRQQMQMGRGECLLDGCVNDDEDWDSDEDGH